MTGLRPYVPPGEMPVGTRLIFYGSHIPPGWVVYEAVVDYLASDAVVQGSDQWFVCEKMMMTGEKE